MKLLIKRKPHHYHDNVMIEQNLKTKSKISSGKEENC
jgi:hypothetical protein